jgi:hypothetical protein
VTLQIDKSITPVAQSPRRIPHHLKKKVNDKLQEMRECGIIERADGANPCLSPLIAPSRRNPESIFTKSLAISLRTSPGVPTFPTTSGCGRTTSIPTMSVRAVADEA